MGTSFGEALGMMMPSSKKQKTSQKVTNSSSSVSSTPSSHFTSPTEKRSTKSTPKSDSQDDRKLEKSIRKINYSTSTSSTSNTPSLLTSAAKLAPLEPELSLEFPTISNNYKPMPLNAIVMDCVFKNNQPAKRFMTDEELGASMSSKNMR